MRRFALLVLVLLLAAPPASALADDQLTIEPAGASRRRSASRSWASRTWSRARTRSRAPPRPCRSPGYSLDRVLDAANVDPFQFGALSIQATSGTVVVTRDEATGTTTFPEGPPVFYVENGDARFLRPARADGEVAELAPAAR